MLKIKELFFWLLAFPLISFSQTIELKGQVFGNSDVEGIHVINNTSKRFTTTNVNGAFIISVKLNDTIQFTSVRYKKETIVVNEDIINSRSVKVYLIENVNVLNKVVVGKILTGDLDSDIENEGEERPLDFYDVGIPGYKGKKKTQVERKYFDADNGSYFNGLSFNVYKFLNKVTGRTKKLKEYMRLEHNNVLINSVKDRLSEDFFAANPLDDKHHVDFFYFCSDDPDFENRCKGKSDIEIHIYLEEKLVEYLNNLNSKDD